MEGGPQRANSAQLAARNIKAAKPRRRPTARLGSPTPQPPSSTAAQAGGGGLFGGSVQATGTFDFAGPGGGLSFPPSSFGVNNSNFGINSFSSPDVSENESDPRADTTGEEAARAKRPFRGFGIPDDQPGNSLFKAPIQPINPFGNVPTQEHPGSFKPFLSSSTQTQQPGFGFSTNTTPDPPATSIFSFGKDSSQTTNIFGAAKPQLQPSTSLFNFGQSITQSAQSGSSQPATSVFNFGQPALKPTQLVQHEPPNRLFNFGQTASETQEKPAPGSGFTFGQTTQSPKINFGASQSNEPPVNNLFGSRRASPAPVSSSLLDPPSQQVNVPSNIFSGLKAPSSQTTNVFGFHNNVSTEAPHEGTIQQTHQVSTNAGSNIFGKPKPQLSPALTLASGQQKSTTSLNDSLGSQKPPVSSLGSASANVDKPNLPPQDLFGHLNKPLESSAGTTNIFAKVNDISPNGANKVEMLSPRATSSIFGQTSSSGIISSPLASTSSDTQPSAENVTNKTPSFPTSTQPSPTSDESNSSPNTLVGAQGYNQALATSKTAPMGEEKLRPQKASGTSAQSDADTTSRIQSSSRVSLIPVLRRFEAMGLAELADTLPQMADAGSYPDEKMESLVPAEYDHEDRQQFYMLYRLRLLNKAMSNYFAVVPPGADTSAGLVFYFKMRELILTRCPPPYRPRRGRRMLPDADQENQDPKDPGSWVKLPAGRDVSVVGRPSSSPRKALSKPTPGVPLNETGAVTVPKQIAPNATPIASSSPQGKRKAEKQLTKDDYERDESREARPLKTSRSNGSSGGSNTSNIFKNILETPEKSASPKMSPEKRSQALPQKPVGDTPRSNPFGNLPMPSVNKSTTKGTSAGSTNVVHPIASATPLSNIFAPSAAHSSTHVPASASVSGSRTSASNDTFAPTPQSGGVFQPSKVQSPPTSDHIDKDKTKSPALKPPTFDSGPGNFLAQFGQKASKCNDDTEKKLMEDAKAEDMDSDEDEAQWEAKYREKRRAELHEIENIAKNKKATFLPGKGFTFGQDSKVSGDVSPKDTTCTSSDESKMKTPDDNTNAGISQNLNASHSFFGSNFAPQSSGNSIFSSVNASKTSTPSGSVLNGNASLKPTSYGANIFAHLSDVESGADSGKGNDGDDESTDEDSDAENDANKENTSQAPTTRPIGEIITSAEGTSSALSSGKLAPGLTFGSNMFGGFGGASSASGASSPGGSLFDRVTKDSSGKPVRQLSAEEKEKSQPGSTNNIFGNISNPFTKSSDAPADKTWKPDSPIKFGLATPKKGDSISAPTVNITAPTPTKAASPFSNLFGNTGGSKPSSLFNALSSTSSVGFNFGGPPSATSSLFPSAAASASTSRATTPGGTTDGESAAEGGDTDAEKHEQIDLTVGGPGEEGEEVLFEARAKAIKFCAKPEGDNTNPWETKGVGPVRVLKNNETGATRILLRADPRGTVVLNKALLAQVKYEATGKTIKLLAAGESGIGLETWILQLKTPEFAASLAEMLEKNKVS